MQRAPNRRRKRLLLICLLAGVMAYLGSFWCFVVNGRIMIDQDEDITFRYRPDAPYSTAERALYWTYLPALTAFKAIGCDLVYALPRVRITSEELPHPGIAAVPSQGPPDSRPPRPGPSAGHGVPRSGQAGPLVA